MKGIDELMRRIWFERTHRPDAPPRRASRPDTPRKTRRPRRRYGTGTKIPKGKRKQLNRARRRQRRATIQAQRRARKRS